jgi:hypothetical protein
MIKPPHTANLLLRRIRKNHSYAENTFKMASALMKKSVSLPMAHINFVKISSLTPNIKQKSVEHF